MLTDQFHRPLRDLRISVTDRCNFRCTYCMPFDHYDWIDKREILTYEEICRVVRLAVPLGVRKIRLTGGEPLLRRDLPDLIQQVASIPGIDDVTLTTNGVRLGEMAASLQSAGLGRINVSIDSLDPERFRRITKRGDLKDVLAGLFEARKGGLSPIKINAVIERGVNEDDILPLVEFGRTHDFVVRFIEYMDVGTANAWQLERTVPKAEILQQIVEQYPLDPVGRAHGNAPAIDYAFRDGKGTIGIVASVTEPFCGTCSRGRLTADGRLVTCLFSRTGHDLKAQLRGSTSDKEIRNWMEAIWGNRTDRISAARLDVLGNTSYATHQQ